MILFCFAPFAHAANDLIVVKPYTRIFNQKDLSLWTIVEKDGLSTKVEADLSRIKLGNAPRNGEHRIYSRRTIAEAIRQSQIHKNWSLKLPHEIVVENKGFDFDRDVVSRQLLANWKQLCSECEFNILSLQLPRIPVEAQNQPWAIFIENKLPRGNFSAKVDFGSSDKSFPIVWVNGQVLIKKRVPVLTRSAVMNSRFTEEDFKLEWRDITTAIDSTPKSEEIIGQKAKFSMSAGDIIWSGSVVREKAVQRGDIVKVSIGEDVWNVSIQAQTEQDGYVGDTIHLRNLQTNRLITGRVKGAGKVEIQ